MMRFLKNKKFIAVFLGIISLLVFILIVQHYQPQKNLWDWLQLLIVPIMLAIGGYWLNKIQKTREEKITERQAKIDREISLDNQQEIALQTYIDKISEFLISNKLNMEDKNIKGIARVRTLTVLRRLNGERKGSVLQFLNESGLITTSDPIIDLTGANLTEAILYKAYLRLAYLRQTDFTKADLSRANLYRANLYKANLTEAKLFLTNLYGANFRGASLHHAKFYGADLRKANLCGAKLYNADLNDANLDNADLRKAYLYRASLKGAILNNTKLEGADLHEANLFGTKITSEQLKSTFSLEGAIMPDGTKHP